MKFFCTATLATALLGGVIFAAAPASARMADPGLRAPSLVETVACRVVRERVRRPNGAVVWRTKRICTPAVVRPGRRCVTERQRVVRPNGAVVFRTVQRCR